MVCILKLHLQAVTFEQFSPVLKHTPTFPLLRACVCILSNTSSWGLLSSFAERPLNFSAAKFLELHISSPLLKREGFLVHCIFV